MPFLICVELSIDITELNCMHETNKIELKLIEVDARSYLGLLSISMGLESYLLSRFERREFIAEKYGFLINKLKESLITNASQF